jgi:hypothetical protein
MTTARGVAAVDLARHPNRAGDVLGARARLTTVEHARPSDVLAAPVRASAAAEARIRVVVRIPRAGRRRPAQTRSSPDTDRDRSTRSAWFDRSTGRGAPCAARRAARPTGRAGTASIRTRPAGTVIEPAGPCVGSVTTEQRRS